MCAAGKLWGWGLDTCGQLGKRDTGRTGGNGEGALRSSSSPSSRAPLPRQLDPSLFAPLVAPKQGGEGRGKGKGEWLVACGTEHTLVGVRGAEVGRGVVVLGVMQEGHGNRSSIDSKVVVPVSMLCPR